MSCCNNIGILNTCTRLWLTESEQTIPVDSIKFEKNLKKAWGHFGRNVVEITIKMKTIVRKPLMIKMNYMSQEKEETGLNESVYNSEKAMS